MQNKWIFGAVAVLSALLAVAFVGCGDDDETPQEAESQVCTDLGELATAIEGVQDLTADSTVDEAQSAVEAVQSAWDDVKSSAAGPGTSRRRRPAELGGRSCRAASRTCPAPTPSARRWPTSNRLRTKWRALAPKPVHRSTAPRQGPKNNTPYRSLPARQAPGLGALRGDRTILVSAAVFFTGQALRIFVSDTTRIRDDMCLVGE